MARYAKSKAKPSLLDFVDTDKVRPNVVTTARKRIKNNHKSINIDDRTYSVQLGPESYQLLKDLKNKYNAYFYTSIRDALFLMNQCLRNTPCRHK